MNAQKFGVGFFLVSHDFEKMKAIIVVPLYLLAKLDFSFTLTLAQVCFMQLDQTFPQRLGIVNLDDMTW